MKLHFMLKTNLSHQYFAVFFSGGMQIFSIFFVSYFDLITEIILSAILFPIKFLVDCWVSWSTLLEAVFAGSIPVFVAVSLSYLQYLSPNFLANDKKPYPLQYFLNFGSVECLVFIMATQ